MLLRRWLIAAAMAAVALGIEREASAYCRTTTCNEAEEDCERNERRCVMSGVNVRWEKQPIPYRIYAGGSKKLNEKKMRAAVQAAFEVWATVECEQGGSPDLSFAQGDDIEDDKESGRKKADEPYGIYFRDKEWPYSKSNDGAADSLALTNQIYGETRGRIEYADIEVNTAEQKFSVSDVDSTDIDFQTVMIHEAGHYIGLAHSDVSKSIMAPVYCSSEARCKNLEAKRELDEDDIRGVCGIYPPKPDDDAKKKAPPPSCAQSAPMRSDLAGVVGLCFVMAALVRRRLRSS